MAFKIAVTAAFLILSTIWWIGSEHVFDTKNHNATFRILAAEPR